MSAPTPARGSFTTSQRRVPVLYVDLDGTVRYNRRDPRGFINRADDVAVFPEALEMMRRWKSGGGRVVAVSNQGGVALGYLTEHQCADAMMRTYHLTDGVFDQIAYCVHHPDATDPEMAQCWCRKPRPGLVIDSARAMAEKFGEVYPPHLALFVGDRPEDRACADAANIEFQDAEDWRAQAGGAR